MIKAYLIFAIIVVFVKSHATTNAYTSSDTNHLELIFCDLCGLAQLHLLVDTLIFFTYVDA